MVSSQARFLKLESDGDLRAGHRDLIDEAGGIVVQVEKPIANLGKEVPDVPPCPGTVQRRKIPTKTVINGGSIFRNRYKAKSEWDLKDSR
jgi:hypothetical protein